VLSEAEYHVFVFCTCIIDQLLNLCGQAQYIISATPTELDILCYVEYLIGLDTICYIEYLI